MNEFKVRKGLIIQGSGSTILDIFGSQGELFSVTDSLSGSLFSVNDISGIPIMEVFSDNTIKLGTYNQEAIIISGSRTGMGTALPQAELHISGANNDSLFRIQSPASSSIIFVSGSGNVGIGTLTPTQKVSVDNGNVGFTSGFGVSWDSDTEWIKRSAAGDQLQFATQNTVRLNIGNTQGQLVTIGLGATTGTAQFQVRGGGATSATTAMRIEDSGGNARLTILDDGTSAFNTSHLYISSSGRIGVGTATPTMGLLDINGIARARSILYFGGTGAGDWQGAISGQASGLLINANLVTINNSGYASPATQSFRIDTSQNVAIGPHSPTARLHVSGASNTVLFEIDSPAQSNIIYVSGSGNVGIGTGTPTNTLQVVGGVTATSFTGSLFGTSSWATNALTSSFITPTDTNAFVQGGNSFGTTALLGTNDNNSLGLETNGSTRLFISSSGNVGIGTGTPTHKLEVSDNVNNALSARIQNFNTSTNASSQLAVGSSGAAVSIIAHSANHTSRPSRIWINSDSAVSNGIWMMSDAGPLRFSAGNTNGNHLFISSSGNVGIGTTNPLALLHISQPSANTIFRLGNNTTYDQFIYFNGNNDWSLGMDYSNSNAFVLSNSSTIGTNDRIVVTTAGNVGIGESTPSAKLEIKGSGATSATTALRIENSNASASLVVLDNGNVGIGTSTPSTSLQVLDSTLFGNSLDDTHIFTGSINTTGSLSLKGPLYDNLGTAGTPDQILYTTSTGVEWRDNIAQSAEDLIITGKNVGVSTIEKGTPLYFTGSGTSGNIIGILPADAGNPDRMPAGGIAGEQITAGNEGDVYIYGFISGVNTSAFSSGDDVFVAVGGGYTNVKPTGSALIQKLGNVEKSDASNGSGVIQGPSWYNDLPNWEIGRVMVGRSNGQPVTSSLVYLDESNGRLGLGTSTPLSTLTVVGGNININSGYGIGGNNVGSFSPFIRYNTNAGIVSSSFGHETAYMLSDGGGIFGANDLSFYAGAVTQPEIMRIVGSTGFVGIGESSPSAKLEIKGSGATSATTALRVENSNASASLTILDDGTSAFNTSHLYISSSGNVGIGTTTPAFPLTVNGSVQVTGTLFSTIIRTTNLQDSISNSNAAINFGGNSKFIQFVTDTVERMRITSAGNVGIGTASPQAQLHVTNSLLVGAASTYFGATSDHPIQLIAGASNKSIGMRADTIYMYPYGSTTTLHFGWNGNSAWRLINQNTSSFQIYNSTPTNAVLVNISSSGNVGIGTTNPTEKLHIVGSNPSSYIAGKIENTGVDGAADFDFQNDAIIWKMGVNASDLFRIRNHTTGDNILNISSSGNVGIGTTTPSSKLELIGNARFDFSDSSTTLSTGGSILRLANSNATTNNISAIDFPQTSAGSGFSRIGVIYKDRTSSSEDQDMFFRTIGNGSSLEVMRLTSTGNVGIGTTTPVLPFEVDPPLVVAPVSTIPDGNIGFCNNSTGGNAPTILSKGNSAAGPNMQIIAAGIDGRTGTADMTFSVRKSDNTDFSTTSNIAAYQFSRSSTPLMTLMRDGNVGIGTTSPSQKLEVRDGFVLVSGSGASGYGYLLNRAGQDSYSIRHLDGGLTINNETDNRKEMTFLGNGNVGIGESTPTAKLQIKGNGATSATTALRVEDSNASASLVVLDNGTVSIGTGTPNTFYALDVLFSSPNAGSARINGNSTVWVFGQTSTVTRGSTGIARMVTMTMGPVTSTSATQTVLTISQSINQSSTAGYTALVVNVNEIATGSGNKLLQSWQFNGTNRTVINNSGSIGVGIDTPSAKLHISGAAADKLLIVDTPSISGSLFVSGSGRVGIQQSNPTDHIHITSNPAATQYIRIDANQNSQSPPLTVASPGKGYGITLDGNYLAEPDYWMEIKLGAAGGGIVLIPCYLPE